MDVSVFTFNTMGTNLGTASLYTNFTKPFRGGGDAISRGKTKMGIEGVRPQGA